jgi:hypothetical protein
MKRRHGSLGAALVIQLAMAVLAGCGSAGDTDNSIASANGGAATTVAAASGEAPAADPDERRLQFTRCMREHGIEVSDPHAGGRPGGADLAGVDPTKVQAAFEACQQYATGLAGGQTSSAEARQQMLDYIKCLRGQGVDIADPDPTTGRPQEKDFAKFINPDQQMKDAMKACEQKRPGAGRSTS